MSGYKSIAVERLTGVFGARISGLDCAQLSSSQWSEIEGVFHHYHVPVFADQTLAPHEHAAFMAHFGELDVHPQELSARSTLPLPGCPKIELRENRPGKYGRRASALHTDVTFRERPPAVTSLYGVETPIGCADTVWVSMRAVFEACSDGIRETLRRLEAVHATAFVRGKAQARSIDYDPTAERDPQWSRDSSTATNGVNATSSYGIIAASCTTVSMIMAKTIREYCIARQVRHSRY